VLCPGNMLTKSCNLLEDGVGRRGPDKWTGLGIVGSHEVLDLSHQFFHAAEGAKANGLLSDGVEPDFNLIQPGSISVGSPDGYGGSEMYLNAGVCSQPALDARMLVRGVVVHDRVDGESLGDVGVDLFEKVQILLMAVAALTPADHRASGQIQGGKQRRGAMANVVVGHAFDIAQAHGKHWLGAF